MTTHASGEALAAFALGDDDEQTAEETAIHVLGCATCARTLEELTQVLAVLEEVRRAAHAPLLSAAELGALAARGLTLQRHTGVAVGIPPTPGPPVGLPPGVAGAIDPAADIVVMEVPVPASGEPTRVQLCALDGTPFRALDAPQDPEATAVHVCCHRIVAELSPGLRVRVERGAALVADVVFAQPRDTGADAP